MTLHLDSSACLSGLSPVLLNYSIATSDFWPHFVHATWQPYLVNYQEVQDGIEYDVLPFKCPGCVQGFEFVSAMFQHWGSSCCDHESVKHIMLEFVQYLRATLGDWVDERINLSGDPRLFMLMAVQHS
jgi:hypothetical protein